MFAAFLDFAVSAGSGLLRLGAFRWSEVSLTRFGDGERNGTGLGSPSSFADRSVRGVEARGEAPVMIGMRAAPDSGRPPSCSTSHPS